MPNDLGPLSVVSPTGKFQDEFRAHKATLVLFATSAAVTLCAIFGEFLFMAN
jgi:hypothetical protein